MKITSAKLDEIIKLTCDKNIDSFSANGAKNMVASINNSMEYKKILGAFVDRFYHAIKKTDDTASDVEKATDACEYLMVYGSILIEVGYHLAKDGVEIYDVS